MKSVGRLATYLQGYGDLLVATNGWDPAVLERFRSDPVVSGFLGGIDTHATTAQLEHLATLLPDEWLAASATGTAAECAATVRGQLDLGCDGVILHGATPDRARARGGRLPGRLNRARHARPHGGCRPVSGCGRGRSP